MTTSQTPRTPASGSGSGAFDPRAATFHRLDVQRLSASDMIDSPPLHDGGAT